MKLRVSEVYLSVQGEGPRVGAATVFIRFAGCNLKCPSWPCDTPHAIDPKIFTKDAEFLDTEEIVDKVKAAAPYGGNICFTGGEPFLQNSDAFEALSYALAEEGFLIQEVFTNGTLRFPDWAIDQFYFVMDWKLPGSGETFATDANNIRIDNVARFNENDVIKFTIADTKDYNGAGDVYEYLLAESLTIADFYYGVVWDKVSPAEIIALVLDAGYDWIYTHQIHNVIWNRTLRGI